MGALGQMSDVYGIRRVRFDEEERTIRVEYDATRLNESTVEKVVAQRRLRRAREIGIGIAPTAVFRRLAVPSPRPRHLACG